MWKYLPRFLQAKNEVIQIRLKPCVMDSSWPDNSKKVWHHRVMTKRCEVMDILSLRRQNFRKRNKNYGSQATWHFCVSRLHIEIRSFFPDSAMRVAVLNWISAGRLMVILSFQIIIRRGKGYILLSRVIQVTKCTWVKVIAILNG